MAWRDITEPETDPDAPLKSEIGKAFRDNPVAIAMGLLNAPVAEAGWHPYDMAAVGDGADGVIYDHSIDGNVTSIETPDFVAGYDYLLMCEGISLGTGLTQSWQLELHNGTAYRSPFDISSSGTQSQSSFAQVPIFAPQFNRANHQGTVLFRGSGQSGESIAWSDTTSSYSILKARLSASSGSTIDAGVITMLRRRNYWQ